MNDIPSGEEFTENPFRSPAEGGDSDFQVGAPVRSGAGYVRQVSIVAMLMIVHGVLLLLLGMLLTGMGVVFATNPAIFNQGNVSVEFDDEEGGVEEENFGDEAADEAADAAEGVAEGGVEFEGMMGVYIGILYGVFGVILLLVGTLQTYAGIRNMALKGRIVGIVALGVGVLAIFTAWCAPTAIALAVYGLIVYLNPSVAHAFKLRSEGHSKEDILALFPR